MQMLFRVALSLLLVATSVAQGGSEEKAFTREFGVRSAAGSFRARFTRDGAGLVWLQAMDHFVSLAAARKTEHTGGDYLLLTANGADHALRLFQEPRAAGFPVDPSTATWGHESLDDGVRFRLDLQNGLELEKTFRHDPRGRGFVVELALHNRSSTATGDLTLQLTGPVLANQSHGSFFGNPAVAIAAPTAGDVQFAKVEPGKALALAVDPRLLSFAGTTNRFFGAFLSPRDDAARAAVTQLDVDARPLKDDPDTGTAAWSSPRLRCGLKLAIPAAGAETRVAFGLYLGPKSFRVFETLPQPELFAPILDVDLDSPCCGGVTIPGGRPMAKLLLHLMGWFHDLCGNWGFAIIMLTILVRGLLAPLNFRMQKSMRAYGARMAKLKPKLDELKVKYADDQKAYQQAMIAFQREHKLIPPIGGCLPIFLTMPVYIGLFTALRTAYDLRHQPFVSWIDDLSVADALFHLPFWPGELNLLPLVWIGLYLVMMLRQPMPTDPQQRQMQQIMRYMPILFGVMLYSYASALLVYMVTSMLWSLLESNVTKRILGPVDPNVASMTPQAI